MWGEGLWEEFWVFGFFQKRFEGFLCLLKKGLWGGFVGRFVGGGFVGQGFVKWVCGGWVCEGRVCKMEDL